MEEAIVCATQHNVCNFVPSDVPYVFFTCLIDTDCVMCMQSERLCPSCETLSAFKK